MNNRFVLRMADFFAKRLKQEAGDDIAAQMRLAHELALGRPVSNKELTLATNFIANHGLVAYCRVLFNTNAFLYLR